MKEKIYSNQEIADQLGIELETFMDLMVELGLLDNNGRPTEFAIKNGLIAEMHFTSQEKTPFDLSNL